MEGRSSTPNPSSVEKSPALSRAGSSSSLRSRAGKRQHGGSSSLNGSQGNLTAAELMCPVCFELIQEAHITRCGHTFCYRCIAKSLETCGRCPKCSFVVGGIDQVFPNFLLNDLVAKHKVSVAAAQASASVGADETALKEFVTTESHRMTLPDVNAVLELLNHRKQLLEAESCAAQNKLLNEFLHNLLQQKEEQLVRLAKEVSLIKKDIGEVEVILKDVEEQAGKLPRMDSEDESESQPLPKLECPTLTARRRRMHAHFDDFVQCYFTSRAKELMFGDDDTTKGSGLDMFRENLVKFSRYNSLRPLASLNYSTGLYNNSTIVSSIEFDKDDELFAIAGVTKRIKVFDYGSVIRDVVDMHYPCIEMVSTSKISCVSWNAYHKSMLASSDYEGTVTVWDACTGKKTLAFQEHEKRCWSVDFNHVDTRLIASGSDDAKVKLWSVNLERSISSLEAKANVCCVKFNPRSSCHLAFGSADHCVHYYDLRSPKEPLALFKGHRKAVSYVKFLSNEEIVSASTDSQLKMWSITKPHCLRSFTGHINEKNFVGLATDGDYVACGSENNALFVYYKGLSKQLFNFKFDAGHGILDKERKEEDAGDFVSAVCWKRSSNVVVAANSQGIIKILELVSGSAIKKGKSRVFFGLPGYTAVAVTGLGKKGLGYNEQEDINEGLEAVRAAASAGCRSLQELEVAKIQVDSLGDAEAAAEGATLGVWKFQGPKSKKAKSTPALELYGESADLWNSGVSKGEAQNFARRLMDTAANLMTPTIFADEVGAALSNLGVKVDIYDQKWAEEKKMSSFLSVSRGSDEPPRFLELNYLGAGKSDSKPVVLVGKGVTFDTGGISLKPASKMDEMRADMGGAACVVATIKAAATLKIPINVRGLIPLCENMPSGRATKPGDVVTAMNGKTIQIDNTDAEGRLILADALCLASQSPNRVIVDMATLTGAMVVCLGNAAAGVFSNSTPMWEELRKAGCHAGDRVWRFPLWNFYSKQLNEIPGADLNNIGKGPGGGSCTAAAFLKEFVGNSTWMHVDIASVMTSSGSEVPYLSKGMAGRPVRTMVQFLSQLSKK